jgi:hypothetical protein
MSMDQWFRNPDLVAFEYWLGKVQAAYAGTLFCSAWAAWVGKGRER